MTIHKAQGLTLDRALIDITQVFSAGQAYVALSRCRSLDGLQIQSFCRGVIRADPKCINFYESLEGKTVKRDWAVEDVSQRFDRLLDTALDCHFDLVEHIPGQEDRERQIFLETIIERYEEARERYKTRSYFAHPIQASSTTVRHGTTVRHQQILSPSSAPRDQIYCREHDSGLFVGPTQSQKHVPDVHTTNEFTIKRELDRSDQWDNTSPKKQRSPIETILIE